MTLDDRFARELPEMAVAWQAERAPEPRLLVLNVPLAVELGLDPDWLRSPGGMGLLTGAHPPDGATPVAQAYAGHQFGGYNPQLGDGRALLLGEVDGRDLALKGSGRTPFARGGDGLAAVGPMLREYVVSEAMHALGIPTTRSLAVVATGAQVRRETVLPGAVLTRVAASHLRVGSFQYASARRDPGLLQRLAEHAIARHHPQAQSPLELYAEVVRRQARLVSQWMLVGFIHGVMNTDNMTISGETIDYGPCAFMEAFDPTTVYSSIDVGGRYAYGNQPAIAEWNLARLAEAMLPLFADKQDAAVAVAVEVLETFRPQFDALATSGMLAKLGLTTTDDDRLVPDVLALLTDNHVDLTSFFRGLSTGAPVRELFLDLQAYDAWAARWQAAAPDTASMVGVNPAYVPRNELVEQALAAATGGDLAPLERLLEAVTSPYEERPGLERFAQPSAVDFGATYQTFCGT